MITTRERILKAIERLGKTEADRAKRIGFTVRSIDNWEAGKGLRTTERLIEAGILQIIETPTEQPTENVTA
jgi:hypothetical protein